MSTKTDKILIEVLNKLKDPYYVLDESKINSYLKELTSHNRLRLELDKLTKYPESVRDIIFHVLTHLDLDLDNLIVSKNWLKINTYKYDIEFCKGELHIHRYVDYNGDEFTFKYNDNCKGLTLIKDTTGSGDTSKIIDCGEGIVYILNNCWQTY